METTAYSPAHYTGTATQPWSSAAHVARVKAALLRSAQDTLDAAGFTQVVAPTLATIAGACGDPGTLIPVELAGGQAYLRQTSQLDLEPLMRELGRVYSIGRSFRAERRADERHLTEFTLIEAEAASWPLDKLMDLMERMVTNMLRHACATAGEHLCALGVRPNSLVPSTPFARMTYDEAVVALQRAGYFIEWGEDLGNSHELALTEMAGGPLFVTHYPVELRFFTMKISRSDPRVVECCDLLLPGVGEVMGASETETDASVLEARMQSSRSIRQIADLGSSTAPYDAYLEARRHSSTTQAGFGMGLERVVRYACGLRTIALAQ